MSQLALNPSELALYDPPDWVIAPISNQISRVLELKTAAASRATASHPDWVEVYIVNATAEQLMGLPNGPQLAATFYACTSLSALSRWVVLEKALAVLRTDGNRPAQVHLVERLLAKEDLVYGIRRKVVEFALQTDVLPFVAPNSTVGVLLKGMIGQSCLAHLREYAPDTIMNKNKIGLVDLLKGLPCRDNIATDDILRDLNWAAYAAAAVPFYRLLSPIFRAIHSPDRNIPTQVAQDDVLVYCLNNSDLKAFREDAVTRGAVVVQTHSMHRTFADDILQSLNVPLSLIGQGTPRNIHQDDFHICTLETTSVAMRLAKLIKLHRKAPRITRILPDGLDSADIVEIAVVGRTIPVSMGAASIAYFGRVPLYFSYSHWDGRGFVVKMIACPQLSECESLDAAKQIFLDFYSACVIEQLNGSPRDLGSAVGVMMQLLWYKQK